MEGANKKNNIAKLINYQKTKTVIRQDIVDILEEMLDLARSGDLQQLVYIYQTQEGLDDRGILGWIEGFEYHMLGLIDRTHQEMSDLIIKWEESDE